MQKLPVIFRAEKSGDHKGMVTAVLPTQAYDRNGSMFTVYAHIGQHGCGSSEWYKGTRAAKPCEYGSLLAELQGIYSRADDPEAVELVIYKKMTPQHVAARRA